ncbi:hypothetical protein BLOT_003528 [Blomia tropicalis]|nr:hypothetical protein BLOT_003528 [Blomia tropicalis]
MHLRYVLYYDHDVDDDWVEWHKLMKRSATSELKSFGTIDEWKPSFSVNFVAKKSKHSTLFLYRMRRIY